MARNRTKAKHQAEMVGKRRQRGAPRHSRGVGLEKQLMERQRGEERMPANGYVPRPKGREPTGGEANHHNEFVKPRMQVGLLRNFLSEAGKKEVLAHGAVPGLLAADDEALPPHVRPPCGGFSCPDASPSFFPRSVPSWNSHRIL